MRILNTKVEEGHFDDDVVEVMTRSKNIQLKELQVSIYNAWIVGISSREHGEGTLLYIPSVTPEELIEGI